MKEFKGHVFYKGDKLEARFCAENLREAASRIGQSKYQTKMHFTYHETIANYSEIRVCADTKRAVEILDTPNWISYDEAKTLIDNHD